MSAGSGPSRTERRLAVQQALFDREGGQHLLLLEHPHVFTYGPRSDLAHNLRCDPAAVGAELVGIKRGGDITYHGPGQLVGYPIVQVPDRIGAAEHVRNVEQLVIDALATFGVSAGRLREYPGVWVDADSSQPRKICAIGVRLKRGRTMHGFALNVATDMRYLPRAHRGVRHRRPPGDVAGRGGRARADARRRRRDRPAGRRAVGERRRRAPGRRVAASCRRPLTVLAWRRAGRTGAPDITPRRRRRDDWTVDRQAQAGLVAASASITGRR